MGRRRDHKPDPNVIVREIRDDAGRMQRHVTIGSVSSYITSKSKSVKLGESWEQQTIPKQRGRKPDRTGNYDVWAKK
tara:strand:+ start:39 stop:269 length:231 start_codon:yes stop_codon:yes gene_type:complete